MDKWMCEISRKNNNRQHRPFAAGVIWGAFKIVCALTLSVILSAPQEERKKALRSISLSSLSLISLSLSLNSFTLSLSILSRSLFPSSQVTITAQFFSGIIFFRPFLFVGNDLRIKKDLTKQG